MPIPTSTHRPPPRPILKASHSAGPPSAHSHLQPPHERAFPASSSGPPTPLRGVHFPPAPRLTRTFSAHPPSDYDRSPIVVAPNTCALPERFGRVYTGEEDKATARSARSPRAESRSNGYGFPAHPQYGFAPCPPLTPDVSSESDDSDACASPPPDLVVAGAHSLPSLSGAHTVPGPSAYSAHGPSAYATHGPGAYLTHTLAYCRRSSPGDRRIHLAECISHARRCPHPRRPRSSLPRLPPARAQKRTTRACCL